MAVRSIVTLVVTLIAVAVSGPAGASFAGENGKIAFARGGVISVAGTAGADPVPLAPRTIDGTAFSDPNTLSASDPAWSPDGSRIAFTGSRLESGKRNLDVYVMNADGSRLERLTYAPSRDVAPAWSPDGSRIVFDSNRGEQAGSRYDIYVMSADGSGVTPLAKDGKNPSWSPDGNMIVFHRFDASVPTWNTFVVSPEGSTPRLVPGLAGISSGLDWSPDGTRVAYTTVVADQGWHLFSAAPDGTDKKQLTRTFKLPIGGGNIGPGGVVGRSLAAKPSEGANFDPTWSPDGKKITFSTGSDFAQPGMYVMNADGTDVREIVTPALAGSQLSWQPLAAAKDPEPEPPTTDNATTPPVIETTSTHAPPIRNSKCTIVGTPGDDVLIGTNKRDVICGLGGDDIIRGKRGNDLIKAGPGNDTLIGNRGRDTLRGGPGNDILKGGPGRDRLLGQAGNDTLHAKNGGRDTLNGGPGTDEARYDRVADKLRKIEAAR